MKLLWVKGTAPLSKLIMWGLNEPVSHFAVVFDDKIVFHSDLLGVRLAWFPSFMKTHEIVEEMDFPSLKLDLEEEVYQSIITNFDGKSYDYGAFLYFCWRGVLWKLFDKPLPSKNAWGSEDAFLCDELAKVLPDWVVPPEIKAMDIGMISPYKLFILLRDHQARVSLPPSS